MFIALVNGVEGLALSLIVSNKKLNLCEWDMIIDRYHVTTNLETCGKEWMKTLTGIKVEVVLALN